MRKELRRLFLTASLLVNTSLIESSVYEYFPKKLEPTSSIFGITGILQMPNARLMQEGSMKIGYSSSFPYEYTYITEGTNNTQEKCDYLLNIPQPDQRTKEWYEFRHNHITASNAWKCLGTPSSVNQIILEKNLTEIDMVEIAEDFFISLGFQPLPQSFWDRSLFVKPADRDVVCHASAWNLDSMDDLRIKMCIEKNEEDFSTIHHELGHIFYYQAYKDQPSVFQRGANDGFHEAVGDLLTLSITPNYLEQIGFATPEEAESAKENQIAFLMKKALDSVVATPWTLMLDKWRMAVFNGELNEDELNDYWWELREKYQGVKAPNERPDDAFDPGAKYHVPGNTPYTRYYLARILQYQFHESLCEQIGFEGPLHECSIYGNEIAGESLRSMLSLGQSEPWQDALESIIGTRELSGTAMLNYYAPLKDWLDEQNQGRDCGW